MMWFMLIIWSICLVMNIVRGITQPYNLPSCGELIGYNVVIIICIILGML